MNAIALKKVVITSVLAVTASSGAFVLAQTTSDRPAGATTTQARIDDRRDGFDWGWIGLLGLAGLAGLRRREHTGVSTRL